MEERLQKYMARCGVASRRKCEELITNGKVKVNGENITELGTKINADIDKVYVNETLIKPEKSKVYIMLNKPEGYVTTNKDEKGRKTILDIVNVNERIYPIGRLDYDSSGLLLLTNDGEIYNRIIHPRVNVDKTYIALVKGKFSKEELLKFQTGVNIGDYTTSEAKIKVIKEYANSSMVEIIIHEGKNRQIRRMCSALGHEVVSLKRVSIGKIKLNHLKKGEWRNLSLEELKYLNSL
ncbi:pseudouridine synthase [Clostridium tarantellae]|uniref:Pseudouridine synthase n=1 Tax=Clostridium tarantellae TaxID=39493 RepID=A0A6I1MM46_9CLOT|nr:pseudouridine synthase [Clostridium tarantellae]MPQ44445.1 pseudouridine synthase [Clostridium tarantellae]